MKKKKPVKTKSKPFKDSDINPQERMRMVNQWNGIMGSEDYLANPASVEEMEERMNNKKALTLHKIGGEPKQKKSGEGAGGNR